MVSTLTVNYFDYYGSRGNNCLYLQAVAEPPMGQGGHLPTLIIQMCL